MKMISFAILVLAGVHAGTSVVEAAPENAVMGMSMIVGAIGFIVGMIGSFGVIASMSERERTRSPDPKLEA